MSNKDESEWCGDQRQLHPQEQIQRINKLALDLDAHREKNFTRMHTLRISTDMRLQELARRISALEESLWGELGTIAPPEDPSPPVAETPTVRSCLAWSMKGTVFMGSLPLQPEEEENALKQLSLAVEAAREHRRKHGTKQ